MRRNNRYPRRNTGVGFSVFIIIIVLAVATGYAGTKYIIYPYFIGSTPDANSDNQQDVDKTTTDAGVDVISSLPSIIIDQQNIKEVPTDSAVSTGNGDALTTANTALKGPFSVQFGSFTTKSGAETLSGQLEEKGIYSYVYESNGSHKVLGLPYSNEEKAKEAAAIVSTVAPDVFVVDLSSLIQ